MRGILDNLSVVPSGAISRKLFLSMCRLMYMKKIGHKIKVRDMNMARASDAKRQTRDR